MEISESVLVNFAGRGAYERGLALMYLTLHDRGRAWKSLDWEATGRLHAKGYIDDPVGKARSVQLTETGLRKSKRLFEALFART